MRCYDYNSTLFLLGLMLYGIAYTLPRHSDLITTYLNITKDLNLNHNIYSMTSSVQYFIDCELFMTEYLPHVHSTVNDWTKKNVLIVLKVPKCTVGS